MLFCQRLPGLVLAPDCSRQAAEPALWVITLRRKAAGCISTDIPCIPPTGYRFFSGFKSYRLEEKKYKIYKLRVAPGDILLMSEN